MAERIQLRRDTASNWLAADPVLAIGEVGIETDSPGKLKIGDGVSAWTSLLYFAPGGITQYAQTVIVAKSGGNYETIGNAIASITDASPSKRYAVLVYPGTYVEQLTMKDYVDIIGARAEGCIITYGDAVLTMSNTVSDLVQVTIAMNLDPATADTSAIAVTSGTHAIRDCILSTVRTTGGYLIKTISHTGGSLTIERTQISQSFTGTTAGALEQYVIQNSSSSGTMRLDGCGIIAYMGPTSDDLLHLIHKPSGSTSQLIITNSFAQVTNLGSGETAGLHIVSAGALLLANAFQFVSGAGDIYGAILEGSSTALQTDGNVLLMASAGGTTYTGRVAATCVWNSVFDYTDAVNRSTGDGVSLVATSFAPGSLTLSSYLALSPSGVLTDGVRALTLANIDQGLLTDGAQDVTGVKTFLSFPVTPSSAPTTDYQVANKKFVDDAIVAANPVSLARLGGNVSSISTSYADVTGLSFAVAANTEYFYEFNIIYQSTTNVCGIGFAINGPASPAAFVCQGSIMTELDGTNTYQNWSADTYDGNGTSVSVQVANADRYAKVRGFLLNGSNAGTLSLRFRSETGVSVSVRTGSIGILRKTS